MYKATIWARPIINGKGEEVTFLTKDLDTARRITKSLLETCVLTKNETLDLYTQDQGKTIIFYDQDGTCIGKVTEV